MSSLALISVNDRNLLMTGKILFAVKRTCLCCTKCVEYKGTGLYVIDVILEHALLTCSYSRE